MKKELNPYIIGFSLVLIILFVVNYFFRPVSEKDHQDTYVLTTDYQDEFIVKEKIVNNFPDIFYDFELYDSNNNSGDGLILKLESVEGSQKEVSAFYSDDTIKCYLVSNYLLFKTIEMDSFQTKEIYGINRLDPDAYRDLIPVVRKLFLDNWEWAYHVSEFLLKCNDTESINLIKKYSEGDFSKSELEKNQYSIYSKTEMEEFFTSLLKKYSTN